MVGPTGPLTAPTNRLRLEHGRRHAERLFHGRESSLATGDPLRNESYSARPRANPRAFKEVAHASKECRVQHPRCERWSQMMDDETIRMLVRRLSRHHPSGGDVIEHAAILAAGSDSAAVLAWIAAHDGQPEVHAPAASRQGLLGGRLNGGNDRGSSPPRRYVLPSGALSERPRGTNPTPAAAKPVDTLASALSRVM